MSELEKKRCIPCQGGTPPLQGETLQKIYQELGNHWKLIENHHIEKEFHFKNFREALDATIQIGEIAEKENHHPNICLSWGQVTVTLWTHKINGLSESDFILAAKIDQRLNGLY